jgi:hypothetical protein
MTAVSPATWTLQDDAMRRRLEPLLRMYPVALAEVRATADPALEPLEKELVETSRYVAGVVAQLNRQLPFS